MTVNIDGIEKALNEATAEIADYKKEVATLNKRVDDDSRVKKTLIKVFASVLFVMTMFIGGLGYTNYELEKQQDALCEAVNDGRIKQYESWDDLIELSFSNPSEVPVDATEAERAQFEARAEASHQLVEDFRGRLRVRLAPVDCGDISADALE